MASTIWNQDINAGEEWKATIILAFSTGVARDLTGHTLSSGVKRHYKSVAHKENMGITVIDAPNGEVMFFLTNTQTSNLKSGKYLYDVELTNDSTLEKERVIEGTITVRPEVTIT